MVPFGATPSENNKTKQAREGQTLGRLTRTHMVEAAIFLLIFAVFYAFSFEFNQPIEIYIFGATAWPRVVLIL